MESVKGSEFWEKLHGRSPILRKDADAIREFVKHAFTSRDAEEALDIFSTPTLMEDIIIYAVFHFLRELGARCYVSNSQIPCVLTMASLSERFVPALLEQNLHRVYTLPKEIRRGIYETPERIIFSYNLAWMMVETYKAREEQRTYLQTIGRAPQEIFPMNITEKVFTPSEAEIDAAFAHVAAFEKGETESTNTPSGRVPIGSSILLMSIASAFHVVPGLFDDMKEYYDDLAREGTETGFRLTTISRAITPYLFAACCTFLRHISKKFADVRIDIGKQENQPGLLTEIYPKRLTEVFQRLVPWERTNTLFRM